MTTLIIKELRERKPVILTGIILSLIPSLYALIAGLLKDPLLISLIFPVAFLNLLLIDVALPIMIAESAVAGEVEAGTLSFLLCLPVSRKRLWCAKIASCFLILYGTLFLSLVTASSLFAFARLRSPGADAAGILIAVIVLVPTVILSLALFVSTVASRTMTASIGTLLLVFLTSFAALFILNGFQWTISLAELILLASAVSLSAAATSWYIFQKAQFLDEGKKIRMALKASGVGLLALTGLVAAIYAGSYYFLSSKATGFESVTAVPGSGRLLADVRCKGFQNYRMWLLDPEKGTTRKFGERRILAPMFVNSTEILYERIVACDMLFMGKVTLEHWMMGSDGKNRKLLFTSVVDAQSLGSFFSKGLSMSDGGGKIFFILPVKEGNYVRLDITVVTREGARLREFRLPERIDRGASVQTSGGISDRGSRVELQHLTRGPRELLSFLFPFTEAGGTRTMILNEVDLESGKCSRISRLVLERDEECPAYQIAPGTGDCLALIKKRGTWKLIYLKRGSGETHKEKESSWKTLYMTEKGTLSRPHFLRDESSVLFIEKERGRKEKALVFNTDENTAKTVFEADGIAGLHLSPDGTRVIFVVNDASGEESPLSLYHKELGSGSPALPVEGVHFNKTDRWTITWRNSGELVYCLWPWHVASVTFSPEGAKVTRLYPFKEEK
ncbi:MAG: ABC transporter permease subunit [Candidatus Eremiobacteraeota bacterium]|nr:ABC transporter permease subunit [Candidatus Eremiobacteraeota bacterium]